MQTRHKLFLVVVVVVPLVFILRNSPVVYHVRMGSQSALKPFLTASSAMANSLAETREYFILFWQTFRKQKEHRMRITALESRVTQLEEAERENERLKKLLDFREGHEGKTIAARVIGWDVSPWRKTVILNKGKKHGVAKDMAVVVPGGFVGRVLETGASTARVILLTDSDARVSALAVESRAQGVVSGDGSDKLKMRYLDLESGVHVGETVLTSGLTGIIPKGLEIGVIHAVSKDRDGLHLVAELNPDAPLSKLEEVLCIASFRPE